MCCATIFNQNYTNNYECPKFIFPQYEIEFTPEIWKKKSSKSASFLKKHFLFFFFQNFRYNIIYPQKSRYILVLERSKVMSLHDRWDILHKAINEFITMLPVGSELSIVTFSKNAIMHLPPTLVTETNKLGLYGRLPKRTTYDEKVCLYCAFNMTFKALQDFEGQIQPASVIFVSGAGSRPENYEILLKLFESAQIHVFTISYPSTSFPQIVDLSRSNGKHFRYNISARWCIVIRIQFTT